MSILYTYLYYHYSGSFSGLLSIDCLKQITTLLNTSTKHSWNNHIYLMFHKTFLDIFFTRYILPGNTYIYYFKIKIKIPHLLYIRYSICKSYNTFHNLSSQDASSFLASRLLSSFTCLLYYLIPQKKRPNKNFLLIWS